MPGPTQVKSSLPTLMAPTAGASCFARFNAFSMVGTSNAAMIGLLIHSVYSNVGRVGKPDLCASRSVPLWRPTFSRIFAVAQPLILIFSPSEGEKRTNLVRQLESLHGGCRR